MPVPVRAVLLCLALLGGVLVSSAVHHPAGAVEAADRQTLREIIERQIDAFRRDDAAGAYAFAAPAIQRLFASEERFMAMVRQGYKPVYRQRSLSFGEGRDTPGGPVQTVRIQDEEGVDWLAVYTFERQPDGSWRIAGCVLLKEPGQPV
jgi:hypothetical protein